MNGVLLLLIVVRREFAEAYRAFLTREGMPSVFTALGEGTASRSMLSLLGLEDTEQAILCTMTDRQAARRLLRRMVSDMGINMPGAGIAVALPVGSIGGKSSAAYLLEKQQPIAGEVPTMQDKPEYPYDLIVAIAQRGHSDEVMNAARGAGARGGTIVHAKGTATEFTAKFFGVSIAEEKDAVLIVTPREGKDGIMRAIMEKAGVRSPARAAVFSLPVDSVAGLASMEEAEGE